MEQRRGHECYARMLKMMSSGMINGQIIYNTIRGNYQECVGERSIRMKMVSRRLLEQQDKNLVLNYLVLSETVRKKTRMKTRRRLKTSRRGFKSPNYRN